MEKCIISNIKNKLSFWKNNNSLCQCGNDPKQEQTCLIP
jgi:hypothetical protein